MCAWVTIVKDAILALSAVVSVSLAVYGVKSWQRELAGKARFEAARRLLQAVYKVREEFWIARSPFISAAEFPPGWAGSHEQSAEEEFDAYLQVYKHRWEPIMVAIQDFSVAALEAEVLFGQRIKEKTDGIQECLGTYRHSIDSELSYIRSGRNDQDREYYRSVKKNLHATRDDDDDLSKKMRDYIAGTEDILRPFLRHDS